MRIFRIIWFRLRALFNRAAVEDELSDELLFHIERETAENIRRGMGPEEARRTAYAQFGGVERFKEDLRDERQVRWFNDISSDFRHAFRLLGTNRLFSASVILTLALGIGATSTIFAIVNGVLIERLPYPDSDRIVSVSEARKGADYARAGQRAFAIWKDGVRSFEDAALFGPNLATLTGHGDAKDVSGMLTMPSFFSVLGAHAALGRTFTAEEGVRGAPRVVVLSDELWRTTFNGDSALLNRSIVLNGNAHTVVGIMPPSFGRPWRAGYFVPLIPPDRPNSDYSFEMIARLRQGVTPAAALLELNSFTSRIEAARAKSFGPTVPVLMSLHDRKFGTTRRPLTILFCAVCVLLLVACANVANLTLARSASRQREFAVRAALGAGRARLIRQLLVESLLLASIGGAVGLLIPVAGLRVFTSFSPASLGGITNIQIDGTVLAFTAGITVLVALLFGAAPALTGTRKEVARSLSAGGARAGQSSAQRTFRSALIVFEVAATLVLLTGAGLITKSFSQALSTDPGFTAENGAVAFISLGRSRFAETSQAVAFFAQLTERVRALPGVQHVSASATKPLGGFTMLAELPRSASDSTRREIAFAEVDGNYGEAAGLHLVAGRFLNDGDQNGSPPVAMISVNAARHFFGTTNAVGQTLPVIVGYGDSARMLVVGVVQDVAQRSRDVAPLPEVFVPSAQHDAPPSYLLVRSTIAPSVMEATIKRFVAEIDPLQALTEFSTMEEELARSIAPRRFNSIFINAFAGSALLLALVGLYGVLAHNVATRTRELGIRIALGAESDRVLRMVLRQGLKLVGAGLVIGIGTAIAFSKTLSSLLYNVPPLDPVVFIGAPIALLLAGAVACFVPARRATQVNPITALRED